MTNRSTITTLGLSFTLSEWVPGPWSGAVVISRRRCQEKVCACIRVSDLGETIERKRERDRERERERGGGGWR